MNNQEYREKFRKEEIPSYYSGPLHIISNGLILIGSIAFFLNRVHNPTYFDYLAFPVILILGNLFVNLFHRYPLHHYYSFAPYAYNVHTKMHHQFYTHEHVVYDSTRDFYILFFPLRVVLGFGILVFPTVYFLAKFLGLGENFASLCAMNSAIYFILYEVFHYISHLPDTSPVLKIRLFAFVREHHRLHHDPRLMQTKNFDIVCPMFDYLFGTYEKGKK